jgi:hypothetical protein
VPAGTRQLPLAAITGGADWKDSDTIKSRLAGGFCLRAPARPGILRLRHMSRHQSCAFA